MRKSLSLAIILTAIALIAYFMKPSEDKCRTIARQKFEEKLQATLPALPANINKEVWQQAMEKSFLESLRVEDRFIYRTLYEQNNAKRKIGWAAFSMVQVNLDEQ